MPRCINCKDKFKPIRFNAKYCMKQECIEVWVKSAAIKQWNKELPKRKEKLGDKAKNARVYLQDEINTLARMIDKSFGFVNCIDCDKPMDSIHAAHLHNSQGNENIRYNLHNLHSARGHCNKYSSEHKVGYRKGLEQRYSLQYKEFVEFEMSLKYKYIGLKANEVQDALKITRKVIREFNSYTFKDGIEARDELNKIIGIYK